MPSNWIFWVLFNLFVLAMLALDLGVFHRKTHVVQFKEAIGWTVVWVTAAGIFAIFLYYFGHTLVGHLGRPNSELSLEFVTGYLIEESLSVDNLFIFLLIFRYFQVPKHNQHAVLFWGVVGALIMRAIFILAGIQLLKRFEWLIYVFGAILIYSGIKLFAQKDQKIEPDKNIVLRLFRKLFPVTKTFEGDRFFVRHRGVLYATPLAIVLVIIETTDLIFAADSIPAVLAVTR